MPTCIFCDNPAGNREHVWPRWILERKDLGAFRLKIANGPEKVLNNVELTVKTVCQSCNNGWMSSLEAEAMPILTEMFEDKSVSLDQEQQQILARWLMKTAMVYDSIKGRNAPNIFYTKDECVAFRQSFQIPMPTMIWIGRFDEVHRDMSGLDFSREVDGDRLTGNVMTITNEHFVAQVLSLHPPQISTGATYIGVEQKQGEWGLALTQIWPPANAAVKWPPPGFFTNGGESGYAYLLHRWRVGTKSGGPIAQ
jgi:hypothetical protein